MRGRPSVFDSDSVILNAQEVFWKKGYSATSLQDLQAATKMGSGSLYNAFKGGKKELFLKAIRQRREDFHKFREELALSDAPIEKIKDFFRSLADSDTESHLKGCIIANSATEMSYVDNDLEAEALQILKDVEEMFTEAIRKAQESGVIRNPASAKILGRHLITFWNGIHVTRRMYPERKELSQLIEMQLDILI